MKAQMRRYRDESDYWRIRSFLRAIVPLDGRPGGNWQAADFDYWRWHWMRNVVEREVDDLFLWEAFDDRIVAVLHHGDLGVCHLHVDPADRTEALEEEMIETAEADLAVAANDGGRILYVWTDEDDALRNGILERRGYENYMSDDVKQHNRRRLLTSPIPATPLAAGYAIRSMGEADELPARSLASWRAFHPGEPDGGCEASGAWYRNVQRAPLYRHDLDVVVIAPDGTVASFATCYFDDVSRTGVFVLVGTAGEHQRRGLAKAAMSEALRRLRWLGAEAAYVSSIEPPAHALYASVGFTEVRLAQAWRKWLAPSSPSSSVASRTEPGAG